MLKNYLKIAWRNLIRNKSYSFINISGLAVALAVLFIVMFYVRHELSYDEYFSTSDRVYRVLMKDESGEVTFEGTPAPIPHELKELYPEVEQGVKLRKSNRERLLETEEKQLYQNGLIDATADFFYLFDYEFIHGDRSASLQEPNSIVITKKLSEKLYEEANPVGKTLQFSERPYTVTGVVENPPSNTHLPFSMVISMRKNTMTSWRGVDGDTYILLDSPQSAEGFRDKLPGYFERHANYPEDTEIGDRGLVLQPVTNVHLYPLGKNQSSSKMVYIRIFLGVAFLILLIASINYINLATARSLERTGEIGVRKTVGASRWQLIRQILTETFVLCGIAFVFSLLLMELALPVVDRFFGVSLSAMSLWTPQWTGIMASTLIILAFLSGGYCALSISRFNPVGMLRGTGFGGVNRSSRLRKVLMVGQFAISLILIMAAVLMYQQMDYVRSNRLDGADSQILVIDSQRNEAITQQFSAFRQELMNQAAVSQAAAGTNMASYSMFMTFENEEGQQSQVYILNGTFGYLETLDRKILSGRSLDPRRASDSTGNYVINETAAHFYGIKEAKGQQIERPVKGNVVGIFEDYHQFSMYDPIKPTIIGVSYDSMVMSNIFVRLEKGQISAGLEQVQSVWDSFQTGIPLNYYFLDQHLDNKYRAELKAMRIFGGFSVFSIFIACLGLFGLAAYTAHTRNKEIGIRKVLGATITNIVGLLSKDFLKLVALGFIIAVPVAYYAMNQWLADFAYKIEIGPGIFLLAGGLALFIALATVSWQSIRAALANPVDSLRSE